MATIATRVDNESRNAVRTIDFQQVARDPYQNSVYPNTIVVPFAKTQAFSRCEAALADLYLFYSWYNIQASFGNNVFSYAFPTASGYQVFNVTIPDGFYSIDELSDYFRTVQIANGTYLTLTADTGATPITYLSWTANDVYYRTTLIAAAVPNAADADYTTPVNYPGGGRSATVQDPTLIFLPTTAPAGSDTPGGYSFSKTLGFSPGEYPTRGTTVSTSLNGQFAPVIESTNVINVSVSMVDNGGITTNPNILQKFSPTVGFGEQIALNPFYPQWMPVADGFYPQIVVQLLDENFVPLNIQDPHISGRIMVRGRG